VEKTEHLIKYLFQSPRRAGLLLIDIAVFASCYYLAFVIRFESFWPEQYMQVFFKVLPLAVLSSVAGMIAAGVYRVMMRYTSIKDLIGIIRGAAYGAALLVAAVVFTYGLKGYPRSVFILYPIMSIGAIGGSRMAWRLYGEARESGVCWDEGSCRDAVRAQLKRGSNVIKLMASGGFSSGTGTLQQRVERGVR